VEQRYASPLVTFTPAIDPFVFLPACYTVDKNAAFG
jgi:hypothetical protein